MTKADELDCWIWRSPRPHNQEIFSLLHGNGLWAGFGLRGTVVTSFDGVNWDLANIGTSGPVSSGAFGSGVFVVNGGDGIYVSTDAHHWTRSPSSPSLNFITYGAGRFVGGDSFGDIWNSPNGLTWANASLSRFGRLSHGSFANGQFFVVISGGSEYFTSSDGLSWSAPYSRGTNGFEKVVYGNGVYLGFRSAFFSATWTETITSADGVNWTSTVVIPDRAFEDVVFVGDRFFAADVTGHMLTSTNGIDWADHDAPALFGTSNLGWADGTFVSAGYFGGLASSKDGLDWTRRSIGPDSSLVGIAHLNNVLVAVGGNLGDGGGSISKSIVATSTNGRDWSEHDPGTTNSLAAVTFGNGRFVAVGAAGVISTSVDANHWNALQPLTSNTLNAVAYGSGSFVAVGGDSIQATIVQSPNGLNWSLVPDGASYPTLYSIAFGSGRFVAVGRLNNLQRGTVLTSPDGLIWTPQLSPATATLRAVAFGNGAFVASGDSGALLQSTDGLSWTNLSRNTSRSLRSIAYGAGWWVIISSSVGQYTSTDGLNWTFRNSLARATALNVYSIAFGGDSFFVTSPWGGILESLPFYPRPQNTTLRLNYTSAPFLTLNGPECRYYEIQSSRTLPVGGPTTWEYVTTVSNNNGSVIIPIQGNLDPGMSVYRAVLRP